MMLGMLTIVRGFFSCRVHHMGLSLLHPRAEVYFFRNMAYEREGAISCHWRGQRVFRSGEKTDLVASAMADSPRRLESKIEIQDHGQPVHHGEQLK